MGIAPLESRSTRGRRALWAALLAAALLALAPAAQADVGEQIILRCTHEESLSGFSQSAYAKALKELSADTEEYSDCSSLIRQAQTAAASGHPTSAGTSAGAAAPAALGATPAEQRAIAHAKSSGSGPVTLAGQIVQPGVVHANISSAFSSLPTPLLASVVLLICFLLLLGAGAVRNRVRAGREN